MFRLIVNSQTIRRNIRQTFSTKSFKSSSLFTSVAIVLLISFSVFIYDYSCNFYACFISFHSFSLSIVSYFYYFFQSSLLKHLSRYLLGRVDMASLRSTIYSGPRGYYRTRSAMLHLDVIV